MSKSLYSKSEELGFDYIEDRYIIDEDYVTTYIELSSCSSFDFEEYIKKCSEAFINLQNTKEYKKFISSKRECDFEFSGDVELNLQCYSWETEDEFIIRKDREREEELKNKQRELKLQQNKLKNEVSQLMTIYKNLPDTEKKKLIKKLTK